MPIGILGSLVVCTVLYVLFRYVLSGVAAVEDFRTERPRGIRRVRDFEVHAGFEWLSSAVTVAILAGFSSVILVMLLGQSRVFYSMSRDGLVPQVFSDMHPKYRTPYKSNILFFCFTAAFAAFVPGRHRRRDDEHRDAVRVHPRLRRRVDHAGAASGSRAGIHGPGDSLRRERSASSSAAR